MSLGVTLVEPVILGVVLNVAVLLIVLSVVTGVATVVGTSSVPTWSRLVGLGAELDLVVCDIVVVLRSACCTKISGLPVTGCIV